MIPAFSHSAVVALLLLLQEQKSLKRMSKKDLVQLADRVANIRSSCEGIMNPDPNPAALCTTSRRGRVLNLLSFVVIHNAS